MGLIRLLLAGTLQSGKTSLLETWTGLRGTPLFASTKQPFESSARWQEHVVHIRDTPAVDSLSKKYCLADQVVQQQPHAIVLLGTHVNYSLFLTLSSLVQETSLPILVLIGKTDLFLAERASLDNIRGALIERRESTCEQLGAMNPAIEQSLVSGRVCVQNAVTYDIYTQSEVLMQEIFDSKKIQEWVLRVATPEPRCY